MTMSSSAIDLSRLFASVFADDFMRRAFGVLVDTTRQLPAMATGRYAISWLGVKLICVSESGARTSKRFAHGIGLGAGSIRKSHVIGPIFRSVAFCRRTGRNTPRRRCSPSCTAVQTLMTSIDDPHWRLRGPLEARDGHMCFVLNPSAGMMRPYFANVGILRESTSFLQADVIETVKHV